MSMALPAARCTYDRHHAWELLLSLADLARAGRPISGRVGYRWEGSGWTETRQLRSAQVWVEAPRITTVPQEAAWDAEAELLLELLAPLVVGEHASSLVVGHLGQSLDGRVATPTGASRFITGREDVIHTHRLRALFDAVLVGVCTVLADDPQLTTRLVAGRHPVRVVVDPRGRLRESCRVLSDGAVTTVVCTEIARVPAERRRGQVEWVGVACDTQGNMPVPALLEALRARGLGRVFVEGGGITISHFLRARALDRLHVSVAPLILGSGTPAFALPPIDQLNEALSLRCRHFSLGPDLLFDCELPRPERRARP